MNEEDNCLVGHAVRSSEHNYLLRSHGRRLCSECLQWVQVREVEVGSLQGKVRPDRIKAAQSGREGANVNRRAGVR